MLTRICLTLTLAGAAAAQQTVAPTDERVGLPRGENHGNYNVTQSFELGYRWRVLGGGSDEGMYRSMVNFGNGVRLLGSRLSVNSRDGHGGLFDEILLSTQGLGNDPYESAMLRVQKNSLYRYDMSWRKQDYYNPALTVAGNNSANGVPYVTFGSVPAPLTTGAFHLRDTSRRLQDHDLILLPQSRFRFRGGYSRSMEDGPGLTTAQEFDVSGPGFPVFANIRREWNEYRAGFDAELAGFRLAVTRRWGFFKEDAPSFFTGVAGVPNVNDQTVLSRFSRTEALDGHNHGWIGNVNGRRRYFAVNARATYLGGERNFAQNEVAAGTAQFGGAATRQILVSGDARRPSTAGDFAISLFPTGKLTIVNNTSILSNRIEGTSSYSEVQTGIDFGRTVDFRFIGIRTVTNSTDVNFRATNQFGVYASYRFSDRELRYRTAFDFPQVPGSASSEEYTVANRLHSGALGVRLRPWKPFTVNLDAEIGRANFPLTPVSEKRYHNLNGRAEYRGRRLQLSTSYRQAYNLAPFALSSFNSHSRNYNANGSWTPRDSFSLDASYTKLHLDTRGGISFFAATGLRPTLQSGFSSYYTSNIHSATLTVRFGIRRRADLYVGYALTKDTGDGRATATAGSVANPVAALLASVQTFPLTYHSPMGRVSIRITEKVRWNAGWQFYNYAEQFHLFTYNQNFRAHTGFTSVLWSF